MLVRLVLWNLADSKTIGKNPDIAEEFDVEATVEGRFEVEQLSRRGLAFEDA